MKAYNLKDKSIIVCSIVRNAAKGLRKNIPVIGELCSMFKSYDVVVYENDSIDDTKRILAEWKAQCPGRIHIVSETLNSAIAIPDSSEVKGNPFFSKKRISKMAMLRNKYMEYIDNLKMVADYIMIVDLDVAKLDIEGILDSFKKADDWDVVTAYGYSCGPKLKRRYHDTYALTLLEYKDIPQTEEMIYGLPYKMARQLKQAEGLLPVVSAFGGLAIYKYEAVNGLRYRALENGDPKVEVRCEHFSLNAGAIKRGFTRICINPEMKLKYQALSMRLIADTVKRKFKS